MHTASSPSGGIEVTCDGDQLLSRVLDHARIHVSGLDRPGVAGRGHVVVGPAEVRLGRAPRGGYLSMSPTTKNIEPRIAIMSATRLPGSISESTWMLLYDAERSFIRHGVFSPCDTR